MFGRGRSNRLMACPDSLAPSDQRTSRTWADARRLRERRRSRPVVEAMEQRLLLWVSAFVQGDLYLYTPSGPQTTETNPFSERGLWEASGKASATKKGGGGVASGSISASADLLTVQTQASIGAMAAAGSLANAHVVVLEAARSEEIYLPGTPYLATVKLTFDAQVKPYSAVSFSGGPGIIYDSGMYSSFFQFVGAIQMDFSAFSGTGTGTTLSVAANALNSDSPVSAPDIDTRAMLRLVSIKVVDPILGEVDPDSIFFGSQLGDTPPPDPGPIPDIIAGSLTRSADGGADFTYSVANAPLPRGTSVSLYWSADDEFDPRLDTPTGYSIAAEGAVGSYGPFHVDASALGTPPQGATHLLVVADPPSESKPSGEVAESAEGNNVKAIETATPDLAVQNGWLGWNTYRGAGITDPERGVDLTYLISGADLKAPPKVDFYWADLNKNKFGGPLPLGPSTVLVMQQGPNQVNEPARWGPAPPNARYIVAVLDPDDEIVESDETNNEVYLQVHTKAEVLNGAVIAKPISPIEIEGSFVPGRNSPDGPYTLSEAEVVFGVNHFNWRQNFHGPGNWEIQAWQKVTAWGSNGRPANGKLIGSGYEATDPIIRGDESDTYYIRVDGFYGLGDVRYFDVPQPTDSFSYYLNESPPAWQSEDAPGGTRSATEFVFRDDPKVPDWAYSGRPNDYMTFSTVLVGVGPGPGFGLITLGDPRLSFTWNSNTIINGDGQIVGGGLRYRGQTYPDPSFEVSPSGGGVFDVRYGDSSSATGFPADPQPIAAPLLAGVAINDGATQRSMVKSLTVSIDAIVTVEPGAFAVHTKGGKAVGLVIASSTTDMNGHTLFHLNFAGSTLIGGSLPDGEYTLTVHGDKIHDAWGQTLDGDLDGVFGGDRVDAFFRLFGDTDGDGDVDNLDYFRLQSTYGKKAGDPGYIAFLDYDGNGTIDRITDFVEFAKRRGKRIGR